MTKRELELLRIARDDIKAGRKWTDRALTRGVHYRAELSWSELIWLSNQIDDITVAGIDVILEAREIVERAVAHG